MKNLFPAFAAPRWLKPAALALGLLAAAPAARAQTAPSLAYGLGTATQNYGGIGAGQQILLPLYPANLSNSSLLYGAGQIIAGVTAGQQLVGIDIRPSTGQLYALGYNKNTGATQLYILSKPNGTSSPITASPVNATAITLNLQDPNASLTGNTANTRGLITNVGFDFNPRADRLRVVAPNGVNYRLNPNTGGLAATDTNLSYASGNALSPNRAPYIGTVAYTNSASAVAGTTLYDIDITNTNGLLSIQNPPNDGILNPVAPVTFKTNTDPDFYPLTSPTIGLDLDIYYDRNSNTNLAYLVEARYTNINGPQPDINNGGSTNQFSNNLWAFNLQTGRAEGRSIFGQIPVFISNIAVMGPVTLVWTGATSTDWQTANNWYPAQVPTANDDVFIAGNGTLVGPGITVAVQPIVTATTSVARTLTLDSNALLTNANGSQLTLSGNFINNGGAVAGAGTGTIALGGSTTQDIGGSTATSFWNLAVGANGATTSAAESIRRSVAVTGTLAIGTGQAFTLLSSAAGTAFVANNGGFVTGLATVQRYITPTNPGLGYRHYSSPVTRNLAASTSNQINDLAVSGVFAPVVNGAYNSSNTPRQVRPYPTVFYYDQARLATSNASYAVGDFDNGFLSPGDLTDVLATTRGYTVNLSGSALVDFQGTLNTGTYPVGTLARGAQTAAGYHLLGNPYPGALSYTVLNTSLNNFQDGLYVYKSSGQYTGSYTTYLTNGQSVNGGSDNIPVAQGFFLRVAAGQTGSGNFTNQSRNNAPETALFQRTTSTAPTLAFTASGNGAANQTRIYFEQGATSGYDNGRDGYYLPASHGLDLASDTSPEAFSINGLPALTGTAVTVPLRLHARVAGTYTLTVDELANLPAGYSAYLRDGLTSTLTNLANTASVQVALDPAEAAAGRFTVIFATSQPLANAPATLAALVGIYPNPAHGAATLVLPQVLRGQAASQVEVLNTLGQVVLRRTVAATSPEAVELPLSGLAAGIYTVRATTATGTVARQLRVE